MAAASFLCTNLIANGGRPSRIMTTVATNMSSNHSEPRGTSVSRRSNPKSRSSDQRLTIVSAKDLMKTQQAYMITETRNCLKPFRFFLTGLGRFPYEQVREKQKQSLLLKSLVKYSLTMAVDLDEFTDDPEAPDLYYFKYDHKSWRSLFYYFNTCFTLGLMGRN